MEGAVSAPQRVLIIMLYTSSMINRKTSKEQNSQTDGRRESNQQCSALSCAPCGIGTTKGQQREPSCCSSSGSQAPEGYRRMWKCASQRRCWLGFYMCTQVSAWKTPPAQWDFSQPGKHLKHCSEAPRSFVTQVNSEMMMMILGQKMHAVNNEMYSQERTNWAEAQWYNKDLYRYSCTVGVLKFSVLCWHFWTPGKNSITGVVTESCKKAPVLNRY